MCNLNGSTTAITNPGEGHTCLVVVVFEEAVADTPVHNEPSDAYSTNTLRLSK